MFIWSKVPTGGLKRAAKKLPSLGNTKVNLTKILLAQLSTPTSPDARRINSAKERQRAEREQLTRLLKESPGKRDTRNFLKQFDSPKQTKSVLKSKTDENVREPGLNDSSSISISGNPGHLNQPTIFTRDPLPDEKYNEEEQSEPLHLTLVKLRQPQNLLDETLDGIALTLSQMAQLGMSTIVVLDCDEHLTSSSHLPDSAFQNVVKREAERLKAALEEHNEPGALIVEQALSQSTWAENQPGIVQVRGSVEVQNSNLIFLPIDNAMIPIVLPIAYDENLKKVKVQANHVLLALIREFSGITARTKYESELGSEGLQSKKSNSFEPPILDRIIILDSLGGIPSESRADGAHAFVNLQAEYADIRKELHKLLETEESGENDSFSLCASKPLTQSTKEQVAPMLNPGTQPQASSVINSHLKNLDVVEQALKLLPPSSSGLILTPSDAAARFKNPLLHNLLTDKPMISSSLPTTPTPRLLSSATPNPATFLKKGIPLTMIPDPRISGPWQPPSASIPSVELADDPRVNLPKLVDLINDSFRRKLDPKVYLDRIRGRLAGIIIAGDYEGGAICTWETPSFLLNTPPGDGASPDSPYWIPYLDKFAVLTSSQGSGGVSDIVWAALARTCFPDGVVWRSRTSNPVNKWYQERAKGMCNLPGDQWTMFWTTERIEAAWNMEDIRGGSAIKPSLTTKGVTRWDAYVDVCSGIQTSWAS